MIKIFISYSHHDEVFAKSLAEFLRRNNFEIWISCINVQLGDDIYEKVGMGLKWCDVFILLWSKSAESSDFVKNEWACAKKLKKRIVPMKLDDSELPPLLSNLHYIDVKEINGIYSQLINYLHSIN